jgi:hypothetical protein
MVGEDRVGRKFFIGETGCQANFVSIDRFLDFGNDIPQNIR